MPPLTGFDPQTVVAVAVPLGTGLFGALWWLAKLEGRVNNHDSAITDIKDDIRDIRDDGKYVRDRIDRVLEREL
jgi:hypothetical protein